MGLRKKKSLIDQASDYVEAVRPQLESAVGTARDAAKDAKDRALPLLADARDKAAPVIAAGAALAAEKAATGASLAADRAAVGRDLAAAKVARLKGEPEPRKKGHRLRKLLILTGLAAAAGFAAKKLQGGSGSDNWQSSYVPSPAPTPAATPATPPTPPTPAAPVAGADEADDAGGSSPDEAIADQAEAPHPVTTPDEPAEVVSIDDAPSSDDKRT